jgi:hypothetical protein
MAGAQTRRRSLLWDSLRRRPAGDRVADGAPAEPAVLREAQLWDRDGLRVHAQLDVRGGLSLVGTHLRRADSGFAGSEYHYVVRVEAAQVPLVVRGLNGTPDDDVLELLTERGEQIVRLGESRWLEKVGVEPRLSSWLSLD